MPDGCQEHDGRCWKHARGMPEARQEGARSAESMPEADQECAKRMLVGSDANVRIVISYLEDPWGCVQHMGGGSDVRMRGARS